MPSGPLRYFAREAAAAGWRKEVDYLPRPGLPSKALNRPEPTCKHLASDDFRIAVDQIAKAPTDPSQGLLVGRLGSFTRSTRVTEPATPPPASKM